MLDIKLAYTFERDSAVETNLYTESEKNHGAVKRYHITSYSTSRATVVEHALSGRRLALFACQ
jgi:hypothetical protein